MAIFGGRRPCRRRLWLSSRGSRTYSAPPSTPPRRHGTRSTALSANRVARPWARWPPQAAASSTAAAASGCSAPGRGFLGAGLPTVGSVADCPLQPRRSVVDPRLPCCADRPDRAGGAAGDVMVAAAATRRAFSLCRRSRGWSGVQPELPLRPGFWSRSGRAAGNPAWWTMRPSSGLLGEIQAAAGRGCRKLHTLATPEIQEYSGASQQHQGVQHQPSAG